MAIQKYREQCDEAYHKSDEYLKKNLEFHNIFLIRKEKNRWVCNKERVDAADFNLLFKMWS